MEYRTAIVDELGEIVAWCDELPGGEDQIETILESRPEYTRRTILIEE